MPETEAQFERAVVELAQAFGWLDYHTRDSRRSNPGFPDLVLVRADRLIFAELKSEKGRVAPAQQQWLDALAATCHRALGVYVWRPSDWPEIERILR